jgi:ankyrin repeat protein
MRSYSPLTTAIIAGDENEVKNLLEKKVSVNAIEADGSTPLMVAAAYQHLNIIRMLLGAGANIHYRSNSTKILCDTALTAAIVGGDNTDIVRLLWDHQVDIHAGSTPALNRAASYDRVNITKMLLEEYKVDIKSVDSGDNTPLLNAAVMGSVATVTELLKHKNIDIYHKNFMGHTARDRAAKVGNYKIVELIDKEIAFRKKQEALNSQIQASIRANQKWKLRELLEPLPLTWSIRDYTEDDRTAVKAAVSHAMKSNNNHEIILSLLLEKGLLTKEEICNLVIETFNIKNLIKDNNILVLREFFNNFSVFESYDYDVYRGIKHHIAYEAILTGHEDVVKLILDIKILEIDDIHTIRAEIYFEKVSHLIKENKVAELKVLFAEHPEFKKDWNISNKFVVATATRDAILAGHEEMVKLVLDSGLEPNAIARDVKSGYFLPFYATKSLIYFAANSGQLNMVTLLIDRGAKIYATEEDRDWIATAKAKQALEGAVKGGHIHIVNDLLVRGADANGLCEYNIMDKDTYLGNAAENGHISIVLALIEHGANIFSTLEFAHEKYERGVRDLGYADDREEKELQLKNTYTKVVKTCLDYASGSDFKSLNFLNGLNVSNMNFQAMTIHGKPITQADIESQNTQGADQAMFTPNVSDPELHKKSKHSSDTAKGLTEKLVALGLYSPTTQASSKSTDFHPAGYKR